MKKILIVIAVLFAVNITAQTQYEKGMSKAMELWNQQKNTEAVQLFERIASAEKDNWLPPYYAATVLIIEGFSIKDETKLTTHLNRAQQLLDAANSIIFTALAKAEVGRDWIRLLVQYAQHSRNASLSSLARALDILTFSGLDTAKAIKSVGILKSKAAVAVAKGKIAVAEGTAETAKVGFPQNIPLLIGFAVQAVSIISAITNATSAASKLKPFFFGGHTGSDGNGSDEYGKITGYTHEKEYVAPAIITEDPYYAPTINKLETARKEKLGVSDAETSDTAENESSALLTSAVYALLDRLEQPIEAFTNIGDDKIQQQQYRLQKINQSRINAKIS